jgi:two-component system, OmpR family, phosphate regulon response regulator PhoB
MHRSELIDRLRTQPEAGEIPIAVLTFRGPQTQRICVFSTNGADGTVKSTEWPSLMARVQAALRSYADDEEACRIRIGDIEIDRPARKVRRGRRDVPLSPTEFQLLEFFMRNPRRVLSRSQVLDSVWQPGSHINARTVDAHVARLRLALVRGRQRDPIRTVRGAGYSFEGK